MAAIKAINSKAEVARAQAALSVNICTTRGLQDVLRTNLGPKGTMKMLVSGAGDIKLTKDGNILLHEMQIQHPTASLIAKVATAQDDITGDGTTSNVLIIGELLKQGDLYMSEVLAQNSGYDLQETLVKVQVEHSESKQPVGIDLNTGEPMVAADAGVWDNYCVKNQLLHSCTVIATNILLVDEIMRAGMSSLKG
ncbi:T-complex protein 1 subunit zeta-2 isoform 2-T5 [Megaptera novaeangliae]